MRYFTKRLKNYQMKELKIAIGLGNPGDRYQNTYHNVGLFAISFFEEKGFFKNLKLFKSEASAMNVSGGYVLKVMKKNKLSPEEILIIHDESDIKIGEYKFSFDRNAAGHNGVQDIISRLNTKAFWRLRVGVQTNTNTHIKAQDFVLKNIPTSENKLIIQSLTAAAHSYEKKRGQRLT